MLNSIFEEKRNDQSELSHSITPVSKQSMKIGNYETCIKYLGNGVGVIPEFPLININISFPDNITVADVDSFRAVYRDHCEAFADAILNLEFGTVEQLWREFWRLQDNNDTDESEDEKYLTKTKLYSLCQSDCILNFMNQVDLMFFQNLVDLLIPNVLRPIPIYLAQAVRNFAKHMEGWLSTAMKECPEEVIRSKKFSVSAFVQMLKRYTSLNHLAQAARAVLQNSSQITQMLNDLNRVDFLNMQVRI